MECKHGNQICSTCHTIGGELHPESSASASNGLPKGWKIEEVDSGIIVTAPDGFSAEVSYASGMAPAIVLYKLCKDILDK